MARPHRPILSRDIIIAAALQLIDRNGRFTIPELAQQLGVSVSSLYHHVEGREDIVEGIRGLLASSMRQPPATDWQDAVTAWARAYRDSFAAHPAVIPLLVSQTVTNPDTLAQYDELAAILHDQAGLDGEELLIAITMIDNLCLGAALDVGAPSDIWATVDRDTPLTRALAQTDTTSRAEKAFETQLQIIVDALTRQTQPT